MPSCGKPPARHLPIVIHLEGTAPGKGIIRLHLVLDYLRTENVAAPGHGLKQLLFAIAQCAPQLDHALDERIIGNGGVWPQRLHQFLLADQASGMFQHVLQGVIHLRPKLDLFSRPKHTLSADIQRELAELIVQGTPSNCAPVCETRVFLRRDFGLFLAFFRYFSSGQLVR